MRRAFATAALTAGVLATLPTPASASGWTPGCGSATGKWSVSSNNLPVWRQVATLHRIQTRCWNSSGYLTSSQVHTWFTDTSTGAALGVQFDESGPYVMHRDGAMQQWSDDFAMKACFAHYTLFCGATMDFRDTAMILAPRLSGWHWYGPFCLTRACTAHVSFRRTG